jgi:hypothetical protein
MIFQDENEVKQYDFLVDHFSLNKLCLQEKCILGKMGDIKAKMMTFLEIIHVYKICFTNFLVKVSRNYS